MKSIPDEFKRDLPDYSDPVAWEWMKKQQYGDDPYFLTNTDIGVMEKYKVVSWFRNTRPKRLYSMDSLVDLHKRFAKAPIGVVWEIVNTFHTKYQFRVEELEQIKKERDDLLKIVHDIDEEPDQSLS